MAIEHISAVTLAVLDMARSVEFYEKLSMELVYGGKESGFSSLRAGEAFINLIHSQSPPGEGWGRVILRVTDVDSFHTDLLGRGLEPESPGDASWGERFFHLRDPDGHELSFAQPLNPTDYS